MSDYIKREDAERMVAGMKSADGLSAVKALGVIPSTDVAPVRHGRWKPFDRTWGRSVFACTVCGDAMDVPTEMGEPIFGYCPDCGAKMDGDADD